VGAQNEFLAIAEATARVAGATLLERFHGPAQGVTTKSSATDPVSDADRARGRRGV
jgi:fructose-1,6-bisphosphatase/inositol monophosphatase family enzyme